jgi:hypothetical protein
MRRECYVCVTTRQSVLPCGSVEIPPLFPGTDIRATLKQFAKAGNHRGLLRDKCFHDKTIV